VLFARGTLYRATIFSLCWLFLVAAACSYHGCKLQTVWTKCLAAQPLTLFLHHPQQVEHLWRVFLAGLGPRAVQVDACRPRHRQHTLPHGCSCHSGFQHTSTIRRLRGYLLSMYSDVSISAQSIMQMLRALLALYDCNDTTRQCHHHDLCVGPPHKGAHAVKSIVGASGSRKPTVVMLNKHPAATAAHISQQKSRSAAVTCCFMAQVAAPGVSSDYANMTETIMCRKIFQLLAR
jgi:hypothetical protein